MPHFNPEMERGEGSENHRRRDGFPFAGEEGKEKNELETVRLNEGSRTKGLRTFFSAARRREFNPNIRINWRRSSTV